MLAGMRNPARRKPMVNSIEDRHDEKSGPYFFGPKPKQRSDSFVTQLKRALSRNWRHNFLKAKNLYESGCIWLHVRKLMPVPGDSAGFSRAATRILQETPRII